MNERKLGMSQSNWIQLLIMLGAVAAGLVATFQCYDSSRSEDLIREREEASKIQRIVDLVEQEANDIADIRSNLEKLNGRIRTAEDNITRHDQRLDYIEGERYR